MKLDLNPDWLIKNMNLWRQAADMQIPLRDDLKVHMMARRSDLRPKQTSPASVANASKEIP
ncbi:hypothetical protein RCH10_004580 [Variovorax sp. GrIS 2.14]|uniref:hypothetical protein n=1 Tax=unclassified Variovorax TaxID=663243 RepID=UPI002B238CBB|nr:hypothetical protein [Variovorax sp. RTB1]MEB0113530.1 hypothetical protein [Variovorax sp. RTB1]